MKKSFCRTLVGASLVAGALAAATAAAAAAAAGMFEPAANIRAAALATVPDRDSAGVRVEVTLDENLHLPACAEPLSAHAGALGTAEVACPTGNWRLHVPLRIQRVQPVVVLTRTIAAGQPFAPDVLRVEMRDVGRMAVSSVADTKGAEGRVARRSLAAGTVLSPQDIASPATVQRGDAVTLVARRGGIEVRAAGRMLTAGATAARVSVENLSSRRIVQGVLQANGDVLLQ